MFGLNKMQNPEVVLKNMQNDIENVMSEFTDVLQIITQLSDHDIKNEGVELGKSFQEIAIKYEQLTPDAIRIFDTMEMQFKAGLEAAVEKQNKKAIIFFDSFLKTIKE